VSRRSTGGRERRRKSREQREEKEGHHVCMYIECEQFERDEGKLKSSETAAKGRYR